MGRMAHALGATLGLVLLAGCELVVGSAEVDGNEPPEREALVEEFEPAPAPELARAWECSYEPTYDDDWHNDVLCSNGIESHRPYLREWDSFVTEDEIMQSAAEYEHELNS